MNPEPIELNVEQWRRDVKTFVSTTLLELDEITDQLSSEVASPSSSRSILLSKPTNSSPSNSASADFLTPIISKETTETRDERLATLKQKLSKLK